MIPQIKIVLYHFRSHAWVNIPYPFIIPTMVIFFLLSGNAFSIMVINHFDVIPFFQITHCFQKEAFISLVNST